VHPYDDPDVIAGQGTIGMELLRQAIRAPIAAIFVPVGGGGLIAGIGAYIKRLRPEIKMIGVEPEDADAMARSTVQEGTHHLPNVGIFADGVAVKQVGEETFRICRDYVDEMLRSQRRHLRGDQGRLRGHPLHPGAGRRAGVAGPRYWAAREKAKNKNLVAIASGANMNFDRLRFVAERAELGEKRETVLAVTIPEKPGSFKKFCALIGGRADHRVQLPLRRPGRCAMSSSASRCRTGPRSTSC
jgi:threonine dehydratase